MAFMKQCLGFLFLSVVVWAQCAPAQAETRDLSSRVTDSVAQRSSLRDLARQDPALETTLQALRNEAAAKGRIDVAVKTAVAFAPETLLGEWEKLKQRREIARAARALRKAMPGALLFNAHKDKPYVTLRLDAPGLARLETLPGVLRIMAADALNWPRDFVQLRSGTRQGTRASAEMMAGGPGLSPMIVGGQDASPGAHPFQVALLYKPEPDDFEAFFCGGTLVAERHVVTAAHCVDFFIGREREIQVLAGARRLDGTGRRIDVTRMILHPGYAFLSLDHDVAVLELAEPVTGIPFATVASTQPVQQGTPLRVTGWGTLAYESDASPLDLQQVDVPFVPTLNRSCGSQRGITSRMICAGEAGKDSCRGDSGGPLTIDRGAGFTELVGIVSFGFECGRQGFPGVYANVAEPGISSFIRRHALRPPSTVGFLASSQTVSEGQRSVVLRIDRSHVGEAVRLRYTTSSGTAVAKSDFKASSGTVFFRERSSTALVSVPLVNDRVKEGPESFTVTLSRPSSGWTVREATATVTITDND